MSKTITGFVSVLAVIVLLAGCTAAPVPAVDSEKAALEDQVEVLNGKIEQLQDKIEGLQKENEALQSDSGASVAVEDLTYLLDVISASGHALTSFPALVSEAAASGEGYQLTVSRLDNPDKNAGESVENVYADVFTYAYYDGYLMPQLDEGFVEYIKSSGGAKFIVYMLGDKVIYLNEIFVP